MNFEFPSSFVAISFLKATYYSNEPTYQKKYEDNSEENRAGSRRGKSIRIATEFTAQNSLDTWYSADGRSCLTSNPSPVKRARSVSDDPTSTSHRAPVSLHRLPRRYFCMLHTFFDTRDAFRSCRGTSSLHCPVSLRLSTRGGANRRERVGVSGVIGFLEAKVLQMLLCYCMRIGYVRGHATPIL
jgi:hypothetical protein